MEIAIVTVLADGLSELEPIPAAIAEKRGLLLFSCSIFCTKYMRKLFH
jgi:hypothetical protein